MSSRRSLTVCCTKGRASRPDSRPLPSGDHLYRPETQTAFSEPKRLLNPCNYEAPNTARSPVSQLLLPHQWFSGFFFLAPYRLVTESESNPFKHISQERQPKTITRVTRCSDICLTEKKKPDLAIILSELK